MSTAEDLREQIAKCERIIVATKEQKANLMRQSIRYCAQDQDKKIKASEQTLAKLKEELVEVEKAEKAKAEKAEAQKVADQLEFAALKAEKAAFEAEKAKKAEAEKAKKAAPKKAAPVKAAPEKAAPEQVAKKPEAAKIVAPEECKVMVSFNDLTAGPEAVQLTNFLNSRGIPTFCTRVYCPSGACSDWQKSTNKGILKADNLVLLITEGWLASSPCQKETETFNQLKDDKEFAHKKVVPVNFPGINKTHYRDPDGVLFNFLNIQQITKADTDWMEQVLKRVA